MFAYDGWLLVFFPEGSDSARLFLNVDECPLWLNLSRISRDLADAVEDTEDVTTVLLPSRDPLDACGIAMTAQKDCIQFSVDGQLLAICKPRGHELHLQTGRPTTSSDLRHIEDYFMARFGGVAGLRIVLMDDHRIVRTFAESNGYEDTGGYFFKELTRGRNRRRRRRSRGKKVESGSRCELTRLPEPSKAVPPKPASRKTRTGDDLPVCPAVKKVKVKVESPSPGSGTDLGQCRPHPPKPKNPPSKSRPASPKPGRGIKAGTKGNVKGNVKGNAKGNTKAAGSDKNASGQRSSGQRSSGHRKASNQKASQKYLPTPANPATNSVIGSAPVKMTDWAADGMTPESLALDSRLERIERLLVHMLQSRPTDESRRLESDLVHLEAQLDQERQQLTDGMFLLCDSLEAHQSRVNNLELVLCEVARHAGVQTHTENQETPIGG
ncbi:MAG: hypothetical protein KVP17_003033 [Porospora cf. gigantea B]|uniref:uncharacterized protein n=1 Tax=Porospora cf. gigantea B TaxID=2853592 RepID=UPI003571B6DA|nr:MAG: hypothetical protein KVP17_003033 [Porospora cf. gigantea B]